MKNELIENQQVSLFKILISYLETDLYNMQEYGNANPKKVKR